MKRFLVVMGGLTIMSSTTTNLISCSKKDYIFELKTGIGEIIDKFDKRNVIEYYFDSWSAAFQVTELVINFKITGLKKYGNKSGNIVFWLKQLVNGLNMRPNQKNISKKVNCDRKRYQSGLEKKLD